MSNDRHLTNNDGTMGNLFRRVTLASLGLDSLDGVSEQSFDVVDKADSFAARLLGGMSHVMPKIDSERLGSQATNLTDRIFEGMSGLNGPSSATDLGEWQYWLDAVLLTLFDEDEEAAQSGVKSVQQTGIKMSQADVRSRVAALKKSGVKPSMLQSLPKAEKRALAQELQAESLNSDKIAKILGQNLNDASKRSGLDGIFSLNSRQNFASHIAQKASMVSAQLAESRSDNAKVYELTERWNKSVQQLSSQAQMDMTTVREMLGALGELESLGSITREQAQELRNAGSSFARRMLVDEISRDSSLIASRMEKMVSKSAMPGALKAVQQDASAGNFKSVFAALNEQLNSFGRAVSSKVLSDGESAATLRWSRSADRFVRLQGVSDDIDRVLLKDIVESAMNLGNSGIVPQNVVNAVLSNAQAADKASAIQSFGTPRVLGSLASSIESSIDSLVRDLSKAGLANDSIQGFVADIQQLVSTGKSVSAMDSASRAASVVESICARLDEFADIAASSVVYSGYDELTMESAGTWVSTVEGKSDDSLAEVRRYQAALQNSQKASQGILQSLVSEHRSAVSGLNAEQSQLVNSISEASDLASLLQAQKLVAPHMSEEARRQLTRTVEAIQNSQNSLNRVNQQIQLIEKTLKLSNGLRSIVQPSGDVIMDNSRLNRSYLSALTGTLSSYAKIRSDYSGMSHSAMTDAIEERLGNMLSIIKPVSERGEDIDLDSLIRSEVSLGYDELISDSMNWVKNAERYPSQSMVGDLSGIFGARKASSFHASDVAGGRISSIESLTSALEKLGADKGAVYSYSVLSDGEAAKISLGSKSAKADFAVRNQLGNAYMPASMRSASQQNSSATLNVERVSMDTVSGAGNFVPVMAGANMTDMNAGGSNAVSKALAQYGVHANTMSDIADKFQLNIGGSDLEMSADAFVNLVSKPTMSSASVNMPSIMDANNALFSGYAAMLSESGDRRSIKTLRQAYMASQAQAGSRSAHAEIGLSTQTFAGLVGATPMISAQQSSAKESSRLSAPEFTASDSLRSFDYANDVDYAWVSNQVQGRVVSEAAGSVQNQSGSEDTRQVLGRIDSMLDYVEKMSDRNVGVFSTDETVRVLLEALPAEGQLGNKGLPKWRQKDTRAARVAEARELRDALAKIGATPVQGVQRLANKQYVSPNLMPAQASGAAPLFSGGDDSGITPSASASVSGSSDSQLASSSIKDEDLQFIAEEIFHKIEESLIEEQQRRRSE